MKVNELQYSITLNKKEVERIVDALHEFYMEYRTSGGDATKRDAMECRELRNEMGSLIKRAFMGDDA